MLPYARSKWVMGESSSSCLSFSVCQSDDSDTTWDWPTSLLACHLINNWCTAKTFWVKLSLLMSSTHHLEMIVKLLSFWGHTKHLAPNDLGWIRQHSLQNPTFSHSCKTNCHHIQNVPKWVHFFKDEVHDYTAMCGLWGVQELNRPLLFETIKNCRK